jgi:hypothetical protein
MQAIDTNTISKEVLAEQNRRVEVISFKDLHTQFLADNNPNKGSEDDYLERHLASGWRKSPDGEGIWRLVNSFGASVTNIPDESCFKNPGPPQVDPSAAVEDQKP